MKLAGLMHVKNEDWVLGMSARVALAWCDELLIFNHDSTDLSAPIIETLEYPGRVVEVRSTDRQWNEMQHRQQLLDVARNRKATHVAIIDADEVLTANLLGSIRDRIEALPDGWMLQLPGYNLRGSTLRYHSSGVWGSRWFSTAFKLSGEARWTGDTFHQREPRGVAWRGVRPVEQHHGGIMHLWGASERRLIAKHALYKVTETLRWPDKARSAIDQEYSQAIKGRPWIGDTPDKWQYRDVPPTWWNYWAPFLKYLHLDAEPWQEKAVRDLVAQHGKERFAELDFFGVA